MSESEVSLDLDVIEERGRLPILRIAAHVAEDYAVLVAEVRRLRQRVADLEARVVGQCATCGAERYKKWLFGEKRQVFVCSVGCDDA